MYILNITNPIKKWQPMKPLFSLKNIIKKTNFTKKAVIIW